MEKKERGSGLPENGADIKKKISAEQAESILKRHGFSVSLKEAQIIVDYLYVIAEIAVKQYNKK